MCRNLEGADAVRKPDKTCSCGAVIPRRSATGKNVYTYKQYCSDECRKKYGKKKQSKPENYITFYCRTCGKEVVRRKSAPGHKFCSNECAQKHTKTKHHLAFRDEDVLLDSSWEGLVWCLASFLKVGIERVNRATAIKLDSGWYAPDLYIPQLDLWIEVKGQEHPDDDAKWTAWKTERGILVVLGYDEIDRLRRADRQSFIEMFSSFLPS
jgi:hypothetical protein